jgi:hypothetical protein
VTMDAQARIKNVLVRMTMERRRDNGRAVGRRVRGAAGAAIGRVGSGHSLVESNDRGGMDMRIFWRVAPWLARLSLVPPTVIFGLIAGKYMTHPVEAGASIDLAFKSALAVTIVRVGFGAFPLGCSIFTLSCLVSKRRLLTGLEFVSTMVVVVLLVRIFGMLVDGTVSENMRLVGVELGLLALMIAGLVIELGRRRIESANV